MLGARRRCGRGTAGGRGRRVLIALVRFVHRAPHSRAPAQISGSTPSSSGGGPPATHTQRAAAGTGGQLLPDTSARAAVAAASPFFTTVTVGLRVPPLGTPPPPSSRQTCQWRRPSRKMAGPRPVGSPVEGCDTHRRRPLQRTAGTSGSDSWLPSESLVTDWAASGFVPDHSGYRVYAKSDLSKIAM